MKKNDDIPVVKFDSKLSSLDSYFEGHQRPKNKDEQPSKPKGEKKPENKG